MYRRCGSLLSLKLLRSGGPEGIPGVYEVVFEGESKVNVMGRDFFNTLHATFLEIDQDPAARVVVLRAAEGHHFSAGLDLKFASEQFFKDTSSLNKAKVVTAAAVGKVTGMSLNPTMTEGGMPAMRSMNLRQLIQRYQDAFSSLNKCRVPVIAAVDKMCLGGGVDLALSADIRYATKGATFSVREAKIGIVADLGTLQRLQLVVGQGHARELALTARDIDGTEAGRIGLANKVFDTNADMLAEAFRTAKQIAANSPLAVQGTKEVLNYSQDHGVEDGLDYVKSFNSAFLKSDDLMRAVVGFAQKKEPTFEDYVVPKAQPPHVAAADPVSK